LKFAICNETFENWSLEDALEFASKAGYTGWEVAPYKLGEDFTQLSSVEKSAYRAKVADAGMEIIGLHWLLAKTSGLHLTSADAPTRKATSEYLGDLARLCHDLGGSVMVLGSPQQRDRADGQSEDEAYMHAANVLRAVVKTLEKNDVKIALEPLGPSETNFMNTAADALRLRELVGSDRIGIHLDMKAMSTEETPIPDIIRSCKDHLLHFHANDPNRQGPGMGDLDIGPAFATLGEIGYEGWVSVEVFDYEPGVEKLVTESIANMRSVLVAN
jgi:sugar phosphate isomerase/epimerase